MSKSKIKQSQKVFVIRRWPRLLDIDLTAEYLSISPKTIRNKLSEGTFAVKPKKIGRKVLFDLRDLDEYVDSLAGYWIQRVTRKLSGGKGVHDLGQERIKKCEEGIHRKGDRTMGAAKKIIEDCEEVNAKIQLAKEKII